jgi:hypothetical protein
MRYFYEMRLLLGTAVAAAAIAATVAPANAASSARPAAQPARSVAPGALQATAARKDCGRVRHRGHSYKVVVQRGRVSCRGARRIVRRWARSLPTRGWMCFLSHGDDVTYGAVCAPEGQDPDFARRRILIY